MMFANIFEGSVSISIILSTPRYIKSFSLIFSKISIWSIMTFNAQHHSSHGVLLARGKAQPVTLAPVVGVNRGK